MGVDSVPLRPEIRVFYPLREGVLITDSWLCADRFRYAIAEIEGLWERQGSMQRARRAALEVIAAETVLVLAVVGVITLIGGPSPLLFGLAALDVVVAAALAGLSAWRWPRPHELWAVYRGRDTRIYSSPDLLEFHKVCRSAQRAVAFHRDEAV